MRKSQLAINSVSTSGESLEERLAAYSGAGFTKVEFVLSHVKDYLALGNTVADVRRLLDTYKLECIGGFEGTLSAFSDQPGRSENHAQIAGNARLIAELGGNCLVVGTDGPSGRTQYPAVIEELAEAFSSIGKLIEETGVNICIEFNWSPVVKSLRTAAEIARLSGAPNVGVLFDPAHYHCTPTKFDQLNEQNIPFIKHVHVNDMQDKPGELSNCNSDRVLPGQGIMNLKAIFDRIEDYGYEGHFSIEMFNDQLWALPAAEAAKQMYDSLLYLCDDGE